ncbi:hypothetical protein [Frigidibacter sp. SD6-1]|nr:hypothetical protein [Frigidibacter sp. SD6-1]
MTKKIASSLLILGLLAACGADGRPTPPAQKPGVTITGTAKAGIVGGS